PGNDAGARSTRPTGRSVQVHRCREAALQVGLAETPPLRVPRLGCADRGRRTVPDSSRRCDPVSEPSVVDQLADGFWERLKQLQPISATINGDNRYDHRLPDTSPEGRAALRQFADDMRDAALAIPD